MKEDSGVKRKVEVEIEVDAPVEAVWKALTDAQELANWFPLAARVKPGKGGSIWLSWGPPVEGEGRIEQWDPPRRLGWVETAFKEKSLAVDFHLEARGGRTLLRLVHSGFERGADWDDMYDSVFCGWHFELRSLRHYLELHHGRKREVVWVRRRFACSIEEAWRRLLGGEGLAKEGSLEGLNPGDHYSIRAATGHGFEGEIATFFPPLHFGATVENLGQSLFRAEIEKHGTTLPEAYVWLSAWHLSPAELRDFHECWTRQLQLLFPEDRAAE